MGDSSREVSGTTVEFTIDGTDRTLRRQLKEAGLTKDELGIMRAISEGGRLTIKLRLKLGVDYETALKMAVQTIKRIKDLLSGTFLKNSDSNEAVRPAMPESLTSSDDAVEAPAAESSRSSDAVPVARGTSCAAEDSQPMSL